MKKYQIIILVLVFLVCMALVFYWGNSPGFFEPEITQEVTFHNSRFEVNTSAWRYGEIFCHEFDYGITKEKVDSVKSKQMTEVNNCVEIYLKLQK